MKYLIVGVALALLFLAAPAAMADTVTSGTLTHTNVEVFAGMNIRTLDWAADASGDCTVTITGIKGTLIRVTFNPDGSTTQPDDNYDVTLKDVDEIDVLEDLLADISGIKEDRLKAGRIIFETSRMDQTKRKDLLLAAFAKILPDYDDLYLFIGGGPENEIFQILNNQLQDTEILKKRAFLTRPIPDKHIGPMFSLADIYATGSEMEGFGMCVLQAAASGTSIASSDVIPFCLNHVPEYVQMFRAGDVGAFADALCQLLNNEDKRNENSIYLRERACVLDWESKTIEFLDYLRKKGMEITKGKKGK